MFRNRFVALFLAVAFALTPHLAAREIDPSTARSQLEALSERWESLVEQLQVPGLSVAVVTRDDVLLTRGFGFRDPEAALPVDEDTLFYIASSTKSILAMGIQILAEEGKLDIDRPVRDYLPRFTLADLEVARAITLRDLLSHARGLRSEPITQGEAYTGQFDDDLYYRLLAEVEPQDGFDYSNLHFTLLGRVIETVTGSPWKEFLTRRVLEPAGMGRTTTSAAEWLADRNAAIPLIRIDGTWRPAPTVKTERTMHAAGGMASNATDLARWLRLQLNGGEIDGRRILSRESLQEMHTPTAQVGSSFFVFGRDAYGLGWYVGTYGGVPVTHHFGGYFGARAHVSFDPEHGIGVATLQNATAPPFFVPDLVAADVYRVLAGAEAEDPLPALVERTLSFGQRYDARNDEYRPLTASDLSRPLAAYAGTYGNLDWGEIEVAPAAYRLRVTWGDLNARLARSEETDAFSFEQSPLDGSPGRFVVDEETGQVNALQIELDGAMETFTRSR